MRQLLLIMMTLPLLTLMAQDYTHDLTGITKVVISVTTNVNLYAYEGPAFLIPEAENGRRKKPEAAAGLTSLTSPGEDNTNYGVEIIREGSQLIVTGLGDRRAGRLVIRLPKDLNISVEALSNTNIYVEGFRSEIEAINRTGNITLKNVTGPVVTENRNGKTLAIFTEINQASPSSLVTTNGDITVKLPPTAAVTIRSQTPRGEFFTDFKVVLNQKRENQAYRRTIAGSINGGGVSLDLQSITGNIYLRKLE